MTGSLSFVTEGETKLTMLSGCQLYIYGLLVRELWSPAFGHWNNADFVQSVFFRRCLTATETIRTVRDGEPRTATWTFTQLLSSVQSYHPSPAACLHPPLQFPLPCLDVLLLVFMRQFQTLKLWGGCADQGGQVHWNCEGVVRIRGGQVHWNCEGVVRIRGVRSWVPNIEIVRGLCGSEGSGPEFQTLKLWGGCADQRGQVLSSKHWNCEGVVRIRGVRSWVPNIEIVRGLCGSEGSGPEFQTLKLWGGCVDQRGQVLSREITWMVFRGQRLVIPSATAPEAHVPSLAVPQLPARERHSAALRSGLAWRPGYQRQVRARAVLESVGNSAGVWKAPWQLGLETLDFESSLERPGKTWNFESLSRPGKFFECLPIGKTGQVTELWNLISEACEVLEFWKLLVTAWHLSPWFWKLTGKARQGLEFWKLMGQARQGLDFESSWARPGKALNFESSLARPVKSLSFENSLSRPGKSFEF